MQLCCLLTVDCSRPPACRYYAVLTERWNLITWACLELPLQEETPMVYHPGSSLVEAKSIDIRCYM